MVALHDQIRMNDAEVGEFLRERRTLSMATIGPTGRIHLVAMWYGFLGENVAIETFAKSQKVQNLRRNPQVTFLIEAGDTYDQLRGVEISGHAIIHHDPTIVMDASRSVITRYHDISDQNQLDAMVVRSARKRVAIEIVSERIASWDHRKSTATD
jgi:PPOX class probable F420-dependent enzyme